MVDQILGFHPHENLRAVQSREQIGQRFGGTVLQLLGRCRRVGLSLIARRNNRSMG
jgi:hypothetical protein